MKYSKLSSSDEKLIISDGYVVNYTDRGAHTGGIVKNHELRGLLGERKCDSATDSCGCSSSEYSNLEQNHAFTRKAIANAILYRKYLPVQS